MKINNKDFDEWTFEDINEIVGKDDFSENEFIDYKKEFTALKVENPNVKKQKVSEFRNDICSFANAEGGDLFFGVDEDKGMPVSFSPILIDDVDQFELDRRNELSKIQPVLPNVKFKFISVTDNQYIVVIHVYKGVFKPYLNLDDKGIFRFYSRHGNGKQPMTYNEIGNDFINAASLSNEIEIFRSKRIKCWRQQDKSKAFALTHIIPASFRNFYDQIPLMDLQNSKQINYKLIFGDLCGDMTVPNVDGIYFPNRDGSFFSNALQLFNNGSVEAFCKLSSLNSNGAEYIECADIFAAVEKTIIDSAKMYEQLIRKSVVYVAISIIGCKGMYNEKPEGITQKLGIKIDRDEIMCTPIEIRDFPEEEELNQGIEKCKKYLAYSLGITNPEKIEWW